MYNRSPVRRNAWTFKQPKCWELRKHTESLLSILTQYVDASNNDDIISTVNNSTCKGSCAVSVVHKPTSRPHIYIYPSGVRTVYAYIYICLYKYIEGCLRSLALSYRWKYSRAKLRSPVVTICFRNAALSRDFPFLCAEQQHGRPRPSIY